MLRRARQVFVRYTLSPLSNGTAFPDRHDRSDDSGTDADHRPRSPVLHAGMSSRQCRADATTAGGGGDAG